MVMIIGIFASGFDAGRVSAARGDRVGRNARVLSHRIAAHELERLKLEVGTSEKKNPTIPLTDGYGTGLRAPTEEEWMEIAANTQYVDSVSLESTIQATSKVDHSSSPWFPPIGNQGSEGSCVAWAVGYYMKTFQEAKEHKWDLTNARWEGSSPTAFSQDRIISPDFIYHLINGGVDQGSSYYGAMNLVCSVGASSWAKMPYNQYDSTTWPSESAWREAVYYRGASTGYETLSVDSEAGIQSLKNWIASDNLAVFSVDAGQYRSFTAGDVWTIDNYEGGSGHANTIVGYDDDFAYTEAGQSSKGAFKIANSWGVGGWEKVPDGFYWMSYKAMSQRTKWVYFYRDRIGYVPTLTASFRIEHPMRAECVVEVGVGGHTSPDSVRRFSEYIYGGEQPFCSNNIVFDITELNSAAPTVDGRSFFLKVFDGGTTSLGTVLHFAIGNLSSTDTPKPTRKSENIYVDITLGPKPAPVLFEDGFESGSYNTWGGTFVTPGEATSVAGTRSHHDRYSAAFSSDGGGGYENAYIYKNVTASELYSRGYFYVSQSGIDAENDRFFFIVFRAGDNGLAYAGWKRNGGAVRWCITTRDGTSYLDAFSSTSPMAGRWYCVELHWRKDPSAGLAEMWVDGILVCSSTGKDSSTLGDASLVQVGLAELYGCAATIVYCDCVVVSSSYAGPEPYVPPPPPPPIDFQDGFESASYSAWNGIEGTSGEPASVIDTLPHHGSYSARFASYTTDRYERICCYKTISANELFARGYFYVSKSGITDDNDRFFFIVFRAGVNGLAYAGWKRSVGVTRWCITTRDGTSYFDVFSSGIPLIGRWYCVELHWSNDPFNGAAELWVDGTLVCSTMGRNTAVYGDTRRIQLGIAEIYGCESTTLYADCVRISNEYISPEPTRAISSLSISSSRENTTSMLGTVIEGVLTPKRIGSNIIIQCRVAGSQSWTRLAIVKTNAGSTYSHSWFPTMASSYEVKAAWLGDTSTLSVETETLRLDCFKDFTSITITTNSSTALGGLRVGVTGRLTDQYGKALKDESIVLYYRYSGILDWTPIIPDETDSSGDYSITWILTTTGYYELKAEWGGNATHSPANAVTSLSSTSYGNQVFSIGSNTSASQLSFNTTDLSLRFSVSGPDNTKGYARVTLPKSLVTDTTKVKVYIDGIEKGFDISLAEDSWLVTFDYASSTHKIVVDLDITVIPEYPGLMILLLSMMATLIVGVLQRKP